MNTVHFIQFMMDSWSFRSIHDHHDYELKIMKMITKIIMNRLLNYELNEMIMKWSNYHELNVMIMTRSWIEWNELWPWFMNVYILSKSLACGGLSSFLHFYFVHDFIKYFCAIVTKAVKKFCLRRAFFTPAFLFHSRFH